MEMDAQENCGPLLDIQCTGTIASASMYKVITVKTLEDEACIFRMMIPEQNRAPGNPVCINSTESGTCELIRPYHKRAIFQQSIFDFRVSSFEIRLVDFEQLTRCQEYLIYSEAQLKPEDEIA